MKPATMPGRQRGLSLIGVVVFGVLVVMLVTVGIRILPSFLEYRAIQKAVDAAAVAGAAGPGAAADVQRAFDRQASIDDIVSVKASDLVIERTGSRLAVSVSYEKRVPLFGPVSLLIEYAAASSP